MYRPIYNKVTSLLIVAFLTFTFALGGMALAIISMGDDLGANPNPVNSLFNADSTINPVVAKTIVDAVDANRFNPGDAFRLFPDRGTGNTLTLSQSMFTLRSRTTSGPAGGFITLWGGDLMQVQNGGMYGVNDGQDALDSVFSDLGLDIESFLWNRQNEVTHAWSPMFVPNSSDFDDIETLLHNITAWWTGYHYFWLSDYGYDFPIHSSASLIQGRASGASAFLRFSDELGKHWEFIGSYWTNAHVVPGINIRLQALRDAVANAPRTITAMLGNGVQDGQVGVHDVLSHSGSGIEWSGTYYVSTLWDDPNQPYLSARMFHFRSSSDNFTWISLRGVDILPYIDQGVITSVFADIHFTISSGDFHAGEGQVIVELFAISEPPFGNTILAAHTATSDTPFPPRQETIFLTPANTTSSDTILMNTLFPTQLDYRTAIAVGDWVKSLYHGVPIMRRIDAIGSGSNPIVTLGMTIGHVISPGEGLAELINVALDLDLQRVDFATDADWDAFTRALYNAQNAAFYLDTLTTVQIIATADVLRDALALRVS